MPLKEIFTEQAYDLIAIKRLYETLGRIIAECSEKTIKNDLVYNGLVFTGLDGVILQLTNFAQQQYKILRQIQAQHLSEFSKKKMEEHLKEQTDQYLINHSKKTLDRAYQKWFPLVDFEREHNPTVLISI